MAEVDHLAAVGAERERGVGVGVPGVGWKSVAAGGTLHESEPQPGLEHDDGVPEQSPPAAGLSALAPLL